MDSRSGAWGSAALALMARVVGAPLVVHHHVFSYFTTPSTAARLFFSIAGSKALHLALCRCMVERLRERYGADRKALVLSNPAFVSLALTPAPRARLLRMGFLGNVTRDKGVGLFMETVRRLSAQGVMLEAQIAGPVRDPALAAEIAAFVAEDPTRRGAPGPVYGDAKQGFLNGIDVLLFPSQYANEAQPVTVYEALAAGAPVLATDRGCMPEQLPADWVFTEEDFVGRASARLLEWATRPEIFAAAANGAAALWNEALARSRGELRDVIAAVRDLGPSRP
jgi:glycosyltransferase involved in cell wall biosynthesis